MRRLLDLVPVGSRNDESIPGLALPHHAQWLPSPDPSQARDEELARQRLAELGASNQLDAQVNRQDLRLIKTVMANARRQTLQTNAGLVAAAYLSTMNCAALVQASNMLNVSISMVRPTEYYGHSCMADLNRWSLMKTDIRHGMRPNKYLENLTKHLLGSSLSFWTQVYDETQASWDRKHSIGVFSSIRLPELDLLARRDSSVLKKYGAKRVEKIFEQQLALMLSRSGCMLYPLVQVSAPLISSAYRPILLCVSHSFWKRKLLNGPTAFRVMTQERLQSTSRKSKGR